MTVLATLQQAAGQGGSGATEFWLFWFLAPISLGAALSMVLLRNPIHGALMLVVNFFTIAIFYVALEAQFLAAIQVIVYAGAIMVLFLFVLMLLGIDKEAEAGRGRLPGQRTAAVLIGVLVLGGLVVGVAGPYLGNDSSCSGSSAAQVAVTDAGPAARPCVGLAGVNAEPGGNVAGAGRLIFTDYFWPFEVASLLLVIAAVGAIVLGRRREAPEDLQDLIPAIEEEPSAVRPAEPEVAEAEEVAP